MHPRANTSSASSSWMPVFDAHYHSHHDGQNMLPGWNSDEADALMNTQHAAGSVDASPLPSPTPPTSDIYSFDQWTAFLSAGQYSNAYASRFLEASNSSPSSNCGFQDSELSSCYPYVTFTSPCATLIIHVQHAPIVDYIPTRRRCLAVSYVSRPNLTRFIQPLLGQRYGWS